MNIEDTGMTLQVYVMGGEYNRNRDPYNRQHSDGFYLEDNLSFKEFSETVENLLSQYRYNMKEDRNECEDDNEEDLWKFKATDKDLEDMYDQYLDRLVGRIEIWDKQDVCELRDMLNTLKNSCKEIPYYRPFSDRIDMSDLPTEEVPESLTYYPVWAMDKEGRCLVGVDANDIEHAEEIMNNTN